jgi:RNA polymerase sigma-70 factor (ECF subfamily)
MANGRDNTLNFPGGMPLATAPNRDFERFLRDQREALVCSLRQHVVHREDAEDLAQESLVRLERYRHSQPRETWKRLLYRIASNLARDLFRYDEARLRNRHDVFDEALHDQPDEACGHEERRVVVMGLPVRCREVYLLNRIEGMSYTEIAGHLGISNKAVEKHVSRALATLRERLGERDADTL